MLNQNKLNRAYTGLRASKKISLLMNALISLCLSMLLMSCSSTQTKYVSVPSTPLPESLTRQCTVPAMPTPFTWQANLLWTESLLTALDNCNIDKAAIRQIETERQNND